MKYLITLFLALFSVQAFAQVDFYSNEKGIFAKPKGGGVVEVVTGKIGEYIPFVNNGVTSTISVSGAEIGIGTTRLTLEPGLYDVSYTILATGSDSTVSGNPSLNGVSGSHVVNRISGEYMQSMYFTLANYANSSQRYIVEVKTTSVFRVVMGELTGGTWSGCSVRMGGALRLR